MAEAACQARKANSDDDTGTHASPGSATAFQAAALDRRSRPRYRAGRRPDRDRLYLVEGDTGHRQDHPGAAIFDGGRAPGRSGAVHGAGRIRNRVARRGPVARLGPGRHRHRGSGAQRRHARPGPPVHHLPPVRDRTGGHQPAHPGGDRQTPAGQAGARFAVGTAAAGGKPAALPAPGGGAETIHGQPPLHHHADRRPLGPRRRLAGAQRGPLRDLARTAEPGLRQRPAPRARGEIPRRGVSRRRARLQDRPQRAGGLSAPGGGRHPQRHQPRQPVERAWTNSTR